MRRPQDRRPRPTTFHPWQRLRRRAHGTTPHTWQHRCFLDGRGRGRHQANGPSSPEPRSINRTELNQPNRAQRTEPRSTNRTWLNQPNQTRPNKAEQNGNLIPMCNLIPSGPVLFMADRVWGLSRPGACRDLIKDWSSSGSCLGLVRSVAVQGLVWAAENRPAPVLATCGLTRLGVSGDLVVSRWLARGG